MSTFVPTELACPHCAVRTSHRIGLSINAARRPALRDTIEAGAFHRFTCAACNGAFSCETTFTYLDFERGQFLMVIPPSERDAWADHVLNFEGLRTRTLTGPEVAPAARGLGESVSARLCFGLPAFREKVLCAAFRIDDISLEIAKLEFYRSAPELRAREQPLRLIACDADGGLVLERAGGETLTFAAEALLRYQRPAYDALRRILLENTYVDLERLLSSDAAPIAI